MFNLINKIAVITGASSGIGKAIANLFLQQGTIVHNLDLQNGDLQHENLYFHQTDITNLQEVKSIFESINKVDILVNNAGIAHVGTAQNTAENDFDKIIAVNIKGAYNCLNSVLPLMQQNGGGVILNMCSIAAFVGIPDRFAYSMSKGAIYAMTLSVAKDFLHNNIRCNCISPARVHTPFVDGFIQKNYPNNKEEMFEKLSKSQPIGRMGTVEEVAALALFLCSNEAAFITGNNYNMDGGFIHLNN